jgi:hypothetical protein
MNGKYEMYRNQSYPVMALFLLEKRDFLGFRMIFKASFNQIYSNFNTMLWTIKYRLSSITVYFTFTIPELWPFVKVLKDLVESYLKYHPET